MKKKSAFKKWVRLLIILPIILLFTVIIVFYFNQDRIVQDRLKVINESFHGQVEVGNTHLALFQNFPYISLIIDDVKVKEHKKDEAPIILEVADIYVGFNLWDVLTGNFDIKSLTVLNFAPRFPAGWNFLKSCLFIFFLFNVATAKASPILN